MVDWRKIRSPFDPEAADENGLVAVGGDLSVPLLLAAYSSGVFPWSSDPVVTWWSPDPRAVFELDDFELARGVRRSVRRGGWTFSVDRAFGAVIRACGESRPDRPETWITDDFVAGYEELHAMDYAHSVEVWSGDALVGGLYGVAIGGFFGGESMFHRCADASKAAVGHLVDTLRAAGFSLLDAQVPTPHLERIGAISIPRADYLERLRVALADPTPSLKRFRAAPATTPDRA